MMTHLSLLLRPIHQIKESISKLKIRNDWQEISRETDAAFVVPASYVVRIEGGSS